jgi:hypothetical protein
MDFTADHAVHDILRNVTARVATGEAVPMEYLGRDQTIRGAEQNAVVVAALTVAVVAMLEVVEVSRADVEVTLDEVLTRCALRSLSVS